jgi:hypothetical protein
VNREQLAHVVRAAATVVGVDDVIVIGSQAILATVDDVELPYEVTRSIEADIAVDHEISSISLGVDRSHLALLIEGGGLVPERERCLDLESSGWAHEGR